MWFCSFFQKQSHLKAVALLPEATSACKMKATIENHKDGLDTLSPQEIQKMIRFGFDKSKQ